MSHKVSIIYVYYDTPREIVRSIETLESATDGLPFEIIIIDNNSSLQLPEYIKKNKKIKILINKENKGYSRGANQGVKIATGDFLLFLNPDTELNKKSIRIMVEKLIKDSRIGLIGPQILDKENNILPSISSMPSLPGAVFVYSFVNKIWKKNAYSRKFWLYDLDRNKEQSVDVISGACMLIKKKMFEKIEGFDERFFMYFEESDLCYRVKKEGFNILFYPKAKIYHMIGKSMGDKDWIKKTFEKSRFIFFQKYSGFLSAFFAEAFLRLFNFQGLCLIFILFLSAFLNLYKIDSLMMFQGDIARDYLAARDMILTGKIPLVGIQSSVTWLHQGPISIYLIAFAFILTKFNPIAPAVLYGVIGIFSTFLVYFLGKTFFNQRVGLLASAFYATSPLVIISARMPYHISSIPFFTSIFFLIFYKILKGKTALFPLLFFILGILLQLELSNAVLFFLIVLTYFFYKQIFQRMNIFKSFLGFVLGLAPFIIYDFTHSFVQTVGLPLWIINRIRLFFGLTVSRNSTAGNFINALHINWQQLSEILFPFSQIIVIILIVLMISSIFLKQKNSKETNLGYFIVILWLLVPLVGYSIHAAPGTAYFPVVFPAVSLLLGFSFFQLISKIKITFLLFFIIILLNSLLTVKNDYFLRTKNSSNLMPPDSYSFGYSRSVLDEAASFLVKDSNNRYFKIESGGFMSKFQTSTDNYKYLSWYKGGKISQNAGLTYTVYENYDEIPKRVRVIYKIESIYITKNEKN